jgi:hypothetical protein
MQNDRYIVFKLISAEELVAHCIHEDDYEIKVLFPMAVRRVARHGGMAESIVLSPYTYFSAEDEYTFQRSQIIFIKDLDSKYEAEYNRSIDDFVGSNAENQEPYNPAELQELTDKLQNLFRDRVKSDEDLIDELPVVTVDIPKTIH